MTTDQNQTNAERIGGPQSMTAQAKPASGAAPKVGHTPGPWEADGLSSGINGAIIINSEWGEVCRVKWTNDDQRDANAKLIAAAPNLLQALKWAASYVPDKDAPCRSAVLAAIAKAEGRAN